MKSSHPVLIIRKKFCHLLEAANQKWLLYSFMIKNNPCLQDKTSFYNVNIFLHQKTIYTCIPLCKELILQRFLKGLETYSRVVIILFRTSLLQVSILYLFFW